jgi:hypothetical protein
LFGCETWSPTLREENVLRYFGTRRWGEYFGSKRDEVVGGWRKLHNEKLRNSYFSPNIIVMIKSRTIRWEGHAACIRYKWNDSVMKARRKETTMKTQKHLEG